MGSDKIIIDIPTPPVIEINVDGVNVKLFVKDGKMVSEYNPKLLDEPTKVLWDYISNYWNDENVNLQTENARLVGLLLEMKGPLTAFTAALADEFKDVIREKIAKIDKAVADSKKGGE